MNGRLYDPELGRMLSPDPFVQVPEYSQNFNRYSYVMNNPLNLTDPTGYSWISNAFHAVGSWLRENWRTVVVIVVGVVLFFVLGPGAFGIAGMGLQGAQLGLAVGASMGAFNAAINGGNLGDVLRGAAIGGISGAISGGILSSMEPAGNALSWQMAEHVVGHGVLGGATNVAMGGKFGDGFLSAAVSAGAADLGAFGFIKGLGPAAVAGRTAVAGIVGGTATALGGGKFANGAYTAAFQHLLNREMPHFGKKPDPGRGLTMGEKALLKENFGNSIDPSKIRIHNFSCLPGARVMTPDGTIYAGGSSYSEDYSKEIV